MAESVGRLSGGRLQSRLAIFQRSGFDTVDTGPSASAPGWGQFNAKSIDLIREGMTLVKPQKPVHRWRSVDSIDRHGMDPPYSPGYTLWRVVTGLGFSSLADRLSAARRLLERGMDPNW